MTTDAKHALQRLLSSSDADERTHCFQFLRSYIESHTGEVVCPRSANGRPESFTVRECVAAGECGCGESVTPGSTVRASPVQPDHIAEVGKKVDPLSIGDK